MLFDKKSLYDRVAELRVYDIHDMILGWMGYFGSTDDHSFELFFLIGKEWVIQRTRFFRMTRGGNVHDEEEKAKHEEKYPW